jgi:hypothetical protein
MAAPRCPQMSAPAPDGVQDPVLLSMHNGRTGTISASSGAGRTDTISASGGARYPDRLSMLSSAQKVWSVPLQPHDPELVAWPFGSISVHQVHGLSQNPNGMEIQGFAQQVQTILCCSIYSMPAVDLERSASSSVYEMYLTACNTGFGRKHCNHTADSMASENSTGFRNKTRASTKTQSVWRGEVARGAFCLPRSALRGLIGCQGAMACRSFEKYVIARKIQLIWRRKAAQAVFQDFVAARRLQTMWRSKSVRSAYVAYTVSRKIQATWLCKSLSSAFQCYVASRRIQAFWSGKSLHASFTKYVSE